jgi:hypothetical protein
MPSESFNEDQAYEVMDGVLEIADCEDPDAVSDIINEELMQNQNKSNSLGLDELIKVLLFKQLLGSDKNNNNNND